MSRGCNGKRRHATWESAVAAAIRLSRANRPLRVYQCDRCGDFHLTHRLARGVAA